MLDMDAEAEELGGSRSFSAGDARYGWAKLMAPSLGRRNSRSVLASKPKRLVAEHDWHAAQFSPARHGGIITFNKRVRAAYAS